MNSIYTDGSFKYDNVYYGFYLLDKNEHEFISTKKMNIHQFLEDSISMNQNKPLSGEYKLSSTIAELYAIKEALIYILDKKAFGEYNIYMDCQKFIDVFYNNHKFRNSDCKLLFSYIKTLYSQLINKKCDISFLKVKSHEDCYGNIRIDNELASLRDPKPKNFYHIKFHKTISSIRNKTNLDLYLSNKYKLSSELIKSYIYNSNLKHFQIGDKMIHRDGLYNVIQTKFKNKQSIGSIIDSLYKIKK